MVKLVARMFPTPASSCVPGPAPCSAFATSYRPRSAKWKSVKLYITSIRHVFPLWNYHFWQLFWLIFIFYVTILFYFWTERWQRCRTHWSTRVNLKFAQTRKSKRFAFFVLTMMMLCAFRRCQVHSRHCFASSLLLLLFGVAQESLHW